MVPETTKIKVIISDSRVIFREGIHFILSGEEDFEVIGETTDNSQVYSAVETDFPTIAILSDCDHKTNCFDIAKRIRYKMPSVHVILIFDIKDPAKVFHAIKSGVSACINPDIQPGQLLDIMRVVAQGSIPLMEELFTPGTASMVIAEFEDVIELNRQFDNVLTNLTSKEQQILAAIAVGGNIEQLTDKLGMTEETIRRNIRIIFNKLVSNDQTRSVIEAAQRNIPAILSVNALTGKTSKEFLTRREFIEFKENLFNRINSLMIELATPSKEEGKVLPKTLEINT